MRSIDSQQLRERRLKRSGCHRNEIAINFTVCNRYRDQIADYVIRRFCWIKKTLIYIVYVLRHEQRQVFEEYELRCKTSLRGDGRKTRGREII